jgi:uridylate kinase
MNCVYVAEMFRTTGISTMVMTPFECGNITKLFRKDDAVAALEQGTVVFFAGGTGHPYFSTDMATVLMAIEIEAEVILAGKAIDGVYDSDPKTNPNAKKYDVMEMQDIVDQKLGVIDLTAAVLAAENHMPMKLFGLNGENSIVNAMTGTFTGTWIRA